MREWRAVARREREIDVRWPEKMRGGGGYLAVIDK
jgi:hypothetical protein